MKNNNTSIVVVVRKRNFHADMASVLIEKWKRNEIKEKEGTYAYVAALEERKTSKSDLRGKKNKKKEKGSRPKKKKVKTCVNYAILYIQYVATS